MGVGGGVGDVLKGTGNRERERERKRERERERERAAHRSKGSKPCQKGHLFP